MRNVYLAMALAGCGTTGEQCVQTLDCTDCPASVADAEASCGTGTPYVDPPTQPACDGLEVVLCTGTNVTANLWMFAGDALVAHATQGCYPSGDVPCGDQGGWMLAGDATDAVLACLAETTPDLYCYE